MSGAAYASMVVNFRIRFDETLHVVGPTDLPAPQRPGHVVDLTTSTAVVAAGLAPSLVGGKADPLSQIVGIVPLRASVDLPGYRQAGRFSIDVLYRDFPIEPDLVRAIAVEIHLGTVSAADWARGNTAQQSAGAVIGFGQSPRASRVVSDDSDEGRRNTVLFGLVDKLETTFDSKGFMVHMEGRDLAGILCDLYVPPRLLRQLNVSLPIDKVVQQILNLVPITKSITGNPGNAVQVVTQADEWPGGVVPIPHTAGSWTRVNLQVGGVGAPASAPEPTQSVQPFSSPGAVVQPKGTINQLKIWDVITQECGLVGAVPFFVGNVLHIRAAVALYDPHKPVFDPTKPTPFKEFKPRTIPGYGSTDIRVMSFGRDILSLKRSRKLGGFKVPTLHLVSADTSSSQRGHARLIEVWWPKPQQYSDVSAKNAESAARTSIAPSGAIAQTEPITIPYPGIKSKAQLLAIAKALYEEIGRGEVGGTCSTKDLWSLGGDNSDPDLLYLRPGDPVKFTVDSRQLQSYPPPISDIATVYRSDPEKLAEELTKKLGDKNLGRVLAYSLTGDLVERQPIYRTNHVRFTWDEKKGVAIDFDFQNYIEARAGITTKLTKRNTSKPALANSSTPSLPAAPATPTVPVTLPAPPALPPPPIPPNPGSRPGPVMTFVNYLASQFGGT